MTGYYRRPSSDFVLAREAVRMLLADLDAVKADLAGLKGRAVLREDIPDPAAVIAELAAPSPLGPSSCVDYHRPAGQAPAGPVRGRSVHMVVNDKRMRFLVMSDPYEQDGESVVDLRGAATGLVLEAVPLSSLDIRRWARDYHEL